MKKKVILLLSLALTACSTSQDVERVALATKRIGDTDNPKPPLTEFVFDDFSSLGTPPAAQFHSIDFVTYEGSNMVPLAQLRMGYNEVYQGAQNGFLWIIQHDNGYGYFSPVLQKYQVVKFTLVYYDGSTHTVLSGVDNRERIPHYWGFNPIVEIRIGCIEYQ